jgi:hypothetical protein
MWDALGEPVCGAQLLLHLAAAQLDAAARAVAADGGGPAASVPGDAGGGGGGGGSLLWQRLRLQVGLLVSQRACVGWGRQ